MFNIFTKLVQKLKQCTNLRLHEENFASFVVSFLVHKMGGGEGALIREGGAYFKFPPMGEELIQRELLSRAEGGR